MKSLTPSGTLSSSVPSNELSRSSSRKLSSRRCVLSVVEVEDMRSCSYTALALSDSSKEKLLVWCLKRGRRGGCAKMIPGVWCVATRETTRGVRLDVRSGELEALWEKTSGERGSLGLNGNCS
jgi:hypothetical protein